MKLFKGKNIVAVAILVTALSSVCMGMEEAGRDVVDGAFSGRVTAALGGFEGGASLLLETIKTLRVKITEFETQVKTLTTLSETNLVTNTELNEVIKALRKEKADLEAQMKYFFKTAKEASGVAEENARAAANFEVDDGDAGNDE